MVNAQSTVGAPWEEFGTGITSTAIAGWEDSVSLVTDTWEDVSNPSTSAVQRVKIWGLTPELSSPDFNWWHEYTFDIVPDDNSSSAYPTFIFHPQPSADTSDPQQDKTYMGFWTGTEGKVVALFRKDKNTDEGSAFTASWMTDRLCPGSNDGGYKMFQNIGFQNSYSDPTSDGLTTLKYLMDFDDPHIRSYSGSLITIAAQARDVKALTTSLGRHIHLYGEDTSQSQSKVLLGEFFIHFRERYRRGGR